MTPRSDRTRSKPVEPISPATQLAHLHQILALASHRNKNQHRLSKWWKAFSMLKTQVSKLYVEVSQLEERRAFGGHGSGGEKKEGRWVREAREKVEARVEYMENYVLEKGYLAFSNLIADNQYSMLGLVLMGALAQIRALLRTLGKALPETEAADEEIERPQAATAAADNAMIVPGLDLGEVVQRVAIRASPAKVQARISDGDGRIDIKQSKKKRTMTPALEGSSKGVERHAVLEESKRKKKKKKGDVFDDMFAGLA